MPFIVAVGISLPSLVRRLFRLPSSSEDRLNMDDADSPSNFALHYLHRRQAYKPQKHRPT